MLLNNFHADFSTELLNKVIYNMFNFNINYFVHIHFITFKNLIYIFTDTY